MINTFEYFMFRAAFYVLRGTRWEAAAAARPPRHPGTLTPSP